MPDSALTQAITIFNEHNYRLVVTTGGPLIKGFYLSEYATYANLTAETLKKLGVRPESVVSVPAPHVRRDRTFASAVAVANWLRHQDTSIDTVDVFSLGPHARRTRLLFQKALGDAIRVGVIAAPSPEYDADKWWTSSAGVRTVIGEAISYLYARLLFDPQRQDTSAAAYKPAAYPSR